VKHIERQVEELLYRKNEILRRATNGVDYSLSEATRLVRERWLQYAKRVDTIEDQIIKASPILNSVNVNVDRTMSKIEEIELREPFRGWHAPFPSYGFPNIYRMMKHLRYTCEHWDELAATWDDSDRDDGLELCQDVLTTLQTDLDSSLREVEPELTDKIAAVRRKRDKMWRHISYDRAVEFKQEHIDNPVPIITLPEMQELDDLMAAVLRNRAMWRTANMRQESDSFASYVGREIIEGLSELYNWLDEFKRKNITDNQPLAYAKPAVDCIFGKKSNPIIVNMFCEMMGGFESRGAQAMRQSWMKILIENATIGTEWDSDKIREARYRFSNEEFEVRLGKDLAASFIGLFEDALAIAKNDDFLNPAGSRNWFSTWEDN